MTAIHAWSTISSSPVAGWPSSLRRGAGGTLLLAGLPLQPGPPQPLGRGLVVTATVTAVHHRPMVVSLDGPRPSGPAVSWLVVSTVERAVIGPPQPATIAWSDGPPVRSCGLPGDLQVGELVALWLPQDPGPVVGRSGSRTGRHCTSTLPVIRRASRSGLHHAR